MNEILDADAFSFVTDGQRMEISTSSIIISFLNNHSTTLSFENKSGHANDSNLVPGMPRLSSESLTGLMILYIFTTILSITGNIFVVLVFVKGRRSRTDLRPFLINLAVADLVMAFFCMPFTFADTILGYWIFTPPLCTLVLFFQLLAVAASVLTNMAIGIDRFLAVLFPLRSRVTYARSKYVLVVIWACALSLASVQFFVGRAVNYGDDIMKCIEVWPDPKSRRIYTIALLLCTYIIPLLILAIAYSIVGILLWKRTAPGNKDTARDLHRLRSKIKIVKMLVIVVAVFGVCWLPIHVFTMTLDFNPEILNFESEEEAMLLMIIFLCVHWLAMSNSFANPIIYGFTNENFRLDLVTLFYMWFPCCSCLQRVIPRVTSSQSKTRDSYIMKRQNTLKNGGKLCTYNATTNRMLSPSHKSQYSSLRQINNENSE